MLHCSSVSVEDPIGHAFVPSSATRYSGDAEAGSGVGFGAGTVGGSGVGTGVSTGVGTLMHIGRRPAKP